MNPESETQLKSFSELTLRPEIMTAIADLGYETPSPIQAQALPILLKSPTDFIGLAATGTGKTAAFGIPLLEKIDVKKRTAQALILCPTRELALQVAGQIDLLGKHLGVRALPIYGGSSYGDQIRGIKSGIQILVATPGRLVDHLERGTIKLNELHTVILDEADEMISMGFKEDLEAILDQTNKEQSHIWLFSATMSREVRKVADAYLRQPQQVAVNRTEVLSTTVEQIYYLTHESNKPEVLCKLIEAAEDFYGIIFCQTKLLVTDLTQFLTTKGYRVDCLHGDKDQNAREKTMRAFREKKVSILVCTDVASRGLDVKDVTHVVNYSIPRELDVYVHRIGRTARSGKAGLALSLVTPSHRGLIGRIEQMTKSRMSEGRVPTRKDIGNKKVGVALETFTNQKAHQRAVELMGEKWKSAIAEMSREEIAGRFLAMIFSDIFVDREPEAPQVRAPAPDRPPMRNRPAPQYGRQAGFDRRPSSHPRHGDERKSINHDRKSHDRKPHASGARPDMDSPMADRPPRRGERLGGGRPVQRWGAPRPATRDNGGRSKPHGQHQGPRGHKS